MKSDGETKERLIVSAKKEFMEKGYMKASLRTICKNAGVTTGALYFFFQDKEDLFASIVEPPFLELIQILDEHLEEDEGLVSLKKWRNLQDLYHDHGDLEEGIVHHLYSNYDSFILLLKGAQGSKFENCLNHLVNKLEEDYRGLINDMIKIKPEIQQDEYMLHWITHMSIDAFIHLLTLEPDEKKAIEHMELITKYIISGWMQLVVRPNNK